MAANWPTNPTPEPVTADKLQIGIIGGSQSGKTTMLGALGIAAAMQREGHWFISPLEDTYQGSDEFLVSTSTKMGIERKFPQGNVSVQEYGYTLTGDLTIERLGFLGQVATSNSDLGGFISTIMRSMSRATRKTVPTNFDILFWDYPGVVLESNPTSPIREELIDYLANCYGLVYLFNAEEPQANYAVLNYTLGLLRHKMRQKLVNGRLPHYLAICVSKFDDDHVFKKLRRLMPGHFHRLNGDLPYVSDPALAFRVLSMPLVQGMLNAFDPKRTEYFMTSSIGFYRNPKTKKIDMEDARNTQTTQDGTVIRGEIEPLNVLEPLLWIYMQYLRAKRH